MSQIIKFLRKFSIFVKVEKKLQALKDAITAVHDIRDLLIHHQTMTLQRIQPNPLNSFGGKCFSQSDEDGITIEIVGRLKISDGVFAEFGVGDGMENNTLILAAMGWRGFWIGGEDLAFSINESSKLRYLKSWITLENITTLTETAMLQIQASDVDVISIDLDGNDIYFASKLLENGVQPKLFIVEYNAQFPPPAKFQVDYDPEHRWAGDNYFGAALQNFCDLFRSYGYMLVCCNSHTGCNAFFVKDSYKELFEDVPKDISKIFVYPRYFLYRNYGHKKTTKVVESILRN